MVGGIVPFHKSRPGHRDAVLHEPRSWQASHQSGETQDAKRPGETDILNETVDAEANGCPAEATPCENEAIRKSSLRLEVLRRDPANNL